MKIMTGDAAVRASVPGTHILDTADGIILFPDAGTGGSTGAGTGDRSGAITCTRAVRYRPGYAGHLPEFWPADAAEACKMARSAKLYAGTYRTPVLLRLPAEIRNSRISVIPKKRTMTERRSADYIMERKKQEEKAAGGTASGAVPAGPSRPLIPEEAFSDSSWNPIYGHGGKGIIVRGPAYRKVIRILNGYSGVRVLKIGTAWPLPESQIRRFLQSVRTALVLDDTQEELLVPVYAVKGKYELTGSIVPFEGMEDSTEDLAAAVIDLAGRDAVMDMLRMRA